MSHIPSSKGWSNLYLIGAQNCLIELLKGQSHDIDQAYFKYNGRSLPTYEPRMVFKIFNFAYYFIFK